MDNMLEIHKLDCFNILTAIDYILRTLLSLETAQKDKLAGSSLKERESEEVAKKICVCLYVFGKFTLLGEKEIMKINCVPFCFYNLACSQSGILI